MVLLPLVPQPQLAGRAGAQATPMRATQRVATAGETHQIILPTIIFIEQASF